MKCDCSSMFVHYLALRYKLPPKMIRHLANYLELKKSFTDMIKTTL